MKFEAPLTEGRLIRRYKRFLADVKLADGQTVTAHCANSGSMMGCDAAGARVWLLPNPNPKAKLDWRWEMVEVGDTLVGINTARPNHIVAEAIEAGKIPELAGYESLKREQKYGKSSRIDILLEDAAKPRAYVEVKNVTLRTGEHAAFPDAVTARGAKHLDELVDMVRAGHRAVMVYLVNRMDCAAFRTADEIDPHYGERLRHALAKGVEAITVRAHLSPEGIHAHGRVPIDLD